MKLTFIVIAFCAALLLTSCSSHSLNTYKGSVKDLLPDQIGEYQKIKEQDVLPKGLAKSRDELKMSEEGGMAYKSNDRGLLFGAMNFDSPENADKALKLLKLNAASEPKGVNVKDTQEKKKGWMSVGERFEMEIFYSRPDGTDVEQANVIYWTNGSVLFAMMSFNGPNAKGPTILELRKLEDSLTY